MNPTPEEIAQMVALVRILIGDTESSPFYPIFSDSEIEAMLRLYNWNVMRAAKQLAISAAFQLSMVTYRERTGDIEVWNNASLQYQKVLGDFIDDANSANLPAHIIPYAAGISKSDYCASISDKDFNRSPLFKIKFCDEWWLSVPNWEKVCYSGCGCQSIGE